MRRKISRKNFKGSVIIITFMVMMIVLTTALSLALVAVKDMKGSIGASKTGYTFQVAEEGIEDVMNDILKKGKIKIGDLANCQSSDGLIKKANLYAVELLDDSNPTKQKINCYVRRDDYLSEIKYLKSVGSFPDNTHLSERAIEAPVVCSATVDSGNTDIVGLWHLEETSGSGEYLSDSSGNENDGTPNGTSVARGICNARSFDGNDDYIRIEDNEDFNFGGGNFTIEAWVYFTSLEAGKHHVIISHWNGGTAANRQFEFYYSVDPDTLNFNYSTTGSPGTVLSAPWNPEANAWYHVAVSRVSGTLYFFINGKQIDSESITGTLFDSTYSVNIGATINDNPPIDDEPQSEFKGYIDEVWLSNVEKTTKICGDFCAGCKKVFPIPASCSSCPACP